MARAAAIVGACMAIFASLPSGAAASTPLVWEPSAKLFWTVNHVAIMALFQNGQCTQWAADKRPDIVQQIVVGSIAADIASGLVESVPNLDAEFWTSEAQRAGISTGHKPRAGALMVFQPGVLGAGPVGHIAYVERVRKHSFTISAMHAPVLGQVSYTKFRKWVARQPGVSFIY
jgi:surface antigen